MAPSKRMILDSQLRTLLAERGLRVTGQRLAILRELGRLSTPISHAELTERLAKTTLDRATVYRTLLSLADAGIVVRSDLGDHVWRFQLVGERGAVHGKHPHLVCNDCGTIQCLPEARLSLRGAAAAKVVVAEVQLRGRCGDCASH